MRAYGLVRRMSLKYMDKQDCLEQGAKSKHMKMTSKVRTASRRVWKGKERMMVRSILRNEHT